MQVLLQALAALPTLVQNVDDVTSVRDNCEQVLATAKQVLAALSVLGGFEELVKPGCRVQVRFHEAQSMFNERKLLASMNY